MPASMMANSSAMDEDEEDAPWQQYRFDEHAKRATDF